MVMKTIQLFSLSLKVLTKKVEEVVVVVDWPFRAPSSTSLPPLSIASSASRSTRRFGASPTRPQCAAVCPVDCCVDDPDYRESEDELLAKKNFLHL